MHLLNYMNYSFCSLKAMFTSINEVKCSRLKTFAFYYYAGNITHACVTYIHTYLYIYIYMTMIDSAWHFFILLLCADILIFSLSCL